MFRRIPKDVCGFISSTTDRLIREGLQRRVKNRLDPIDSSFSPFCYMWGTE